MRRISPPCCGGWKKQQVSRLFPNESSLHSPTHSFLCSRNSVREALPRLRPSFRRLDPGGQSKIKACAAREVVGSPQAAIMGLDDGAADAKSHASAVTLRGEEWIKYLVRLLGWKTYTGIADRAHQLRVFGALRLDGELARP